VEVIHLPITMILAHGSCTCYTAGVKTAILLCRLMIFSVVFRVFATDIRLTARRLQTTSSTPFSQISPQVRASVIPTVRRWIS